MPSTINKVCMQQLPEGGYYFRSYDSRVEDDDPEGNPQLMKWNIPIAARYAIDNYGAPMDMRADGKLSIGYCRHPLIQQLPVRQIADRIEVEREAARRYIEAVMSQQVDPLKTEAGFPIYSDIEQPKRFWSDADIMEIVDSRPTDEVVTLFVDPINEVIKEVDIADYEFQGGIY